MGLNITVHSQNHKVFPSDPEDNLHNNSVCMSVHTTILLNKLGGVESIYQQEKLNFSAHFLMIGNFKNGRQALARGDN